MTVASSTCCRHIAYAAEWTVLMQVEDGELDVEN